MGLCVFTDVRILDAENISGDKETQLVNILFKRKKYQKDTLNNLNNLSFFISKNKQKVLKAKRKRNLS